MSTSDHIHPSELTRYHQSEATQARAQEIQSHLSGCAACRAELNNIQMLVDSLAQSEEELSGMDLAAKVQRAIRDGIPVQRRRAWLWPVLAGAAAAGVAVVTVLFLDLHSAQKSEGAPDDIRTKTGLSDGVEADHWVRLDVYQVTEGKKPVAVKDRIQSDAAVLFSYSNLGSKPFGYLMIFAVDEKGQVYWYYPAFLQAGTDPTSIPIEKNMDRVELPDQVRHRFAPGTVRLLGLFTREPRAVSSVEAMIQDLIHVGKWSDATARLPIEDSAQFVLSMKVEP